MSYRVLWHEDAIKDLRGIGKSDAQRIILKVETYLSHNPYRLGKTLKGHLKGFFRYRIGAYRVIYTIEEDKLFILIIRVGKRDIIYRTK